MFTPVRMYGIKAGVNFLSVTHTGNSYSYFGFHGGFFHEGHVWRNSGYGLEFLFSNQGYSSSTFNYLCVPVMANYYIGPVTLQGGGYGALLLSATTGKYPYKTDISGSAPGLDYGLIAGVKFRVFKKAALGARYYLGLQDIDQSYPGEPSTYNRNIQISVGYDF